ncbi:basic secretory protein-like protein [Sphingobacterium wenxiniae]|uniref:Peptidase n=1 Tax=Sphingobacterium wenxiniae TaxID=683125 RepID=A0A1I6TUZ8_9SPHI|nr:basic secretory protein-like protein [Sphingobacterium wenxiniae]SFS92995.1 Peptidase [Sphingobacterium wenxiniae]
MYRHALKIFVIILSIVVLGSPLKKVCAQVDSDKGYKVEIIAENPYFSQKYLARLEGVFYQVYPKLVNDFNENSPRKVTITIDTTYDGVAYAHNGRVVISQGWLEKNPEDIDVVTHEVMHIVQAYPPRSGPGWLVEGIADYVRDKYGVNNTGANWSLPDLKEGQHYTNSYRIAARFLKWIELNKQKGIVKKLDVALRNKEYSDVIWVDNTKMTLDQLWDAYEKENIVIN